MAKPHTQSTAAPSSRVACSKRIVWSRRPAAKSPAFWCRPGPSASSSVEAAIVGLAGCEIYGRDPVGKLVVVVDAPTPARWDDAQHHRAVARRLHRLARLSRHRCRRLTSEGTAMTAPKLDRRQVLKLEAAAMAALAGGMPAPASRPTSSPNAPPAN